MSRKRDTIPFFGHFAEERSILLFEELSAKSADDPEGPAIADQIALKRQELERNHPEFMAQLRQQESGQTQLESLQRQMGSLGIELVFPNQ
jgi:hypothetical protein